MTTLLTRGRMNGSTTMNSCVRSAATMNASLWLSVSASTSATSWSAFASPSRQVSSSLTTPCTTLVHTLVQNCLRCRQHLQMKCASCCRRHVSCRLQSMSYPLRCSARPSTSSRRSLLTSPTCRSPNVAFRHPSKRPRCCRC